VFDDRTDGTSIDEDAEVHDAVSRVWFHQPLLRLAVMTILNARSGKLL
jgi:hypothetical protein